MKLRTRFRFAFDMFIRHWKTNFLIILFFSITIYMAVDALKTYYFSVYPVNKIKELYRGNLSDFYVVEISIENFDPYHPHKDKILGERWKDLMVSIYDMPEVSGFGIVDRTNGCEGMTLPEYIEDKTVRKWYIKLLEDAKPKATFANSNMGHIDYITVSDTDLDMYEIRLADGSRLTKEYIDSFNGEYSNIYFLGAGLADRETGFVFDEYEGYKSYVDTSLSKNQQWVPFDNITGNGSHVFYSLDNAIVDVAVTDKSALWGYDNYFYLCLNKDIDNKEVLKAIEKLAREKDFEISIGSVEKTLGVNQRKNLELCSLLFESCVIWVLISIILCSAVQIIVALEDRMIHGIWCANGAKKKDILVICFIENTLRTFFGGIIGLSFYYYYYFSHINTERLIICAGDALKFSVTRGIIILLVIYIVSGLIPYFITKKSQVATLLTGGLK